MQNLTLTLTLDETNLVLEALGQLPFARVYALVAKIQAQAGEQITPRPAPVAATPPPPTASQAP